MVDVVLFHGRLASLYASWKEEPEAWSSAQAVVMASGEDDERTTYHTSVALQLYLFELELPNTLLLLLPDKLYIATSRKKCKKLATLATEGGDGVPAVGFIEVPKADFGEAFAKVLETASEAGASVLGVSKASEKPFGDFVEGWASALTESSTESVEVHAGIEAALARKQEAELKHLKTAAIFGCAVMKKHLIPKLEDILDKETATKHSSIASGVDKIFEDPSRLKWKKFPSENVDLCYPPIIQSGGDYDLKANAQTNEEPLHPGVILCRIGARYKSYCSNLGRTFLVNPTEAQQSSYKVLEQLHAHVLKMFKPGTRLGDVSAAAKSFLEQEAPELLPKLTKNCGHGIGLQFRESSMRLVAKNDKVMAEGMTFSVSVGLDGLEDKSLDKKVRTYSLLICDTVVVTDDGYELYTSAVSSKAEQIIYELGNDDAAEDGEDAGDAAENRPDLSRIYEAATAGESTDRNKEQREVLSEQQQRQREMGKKQRDAMVKRFSADADSEAKSKSRNYVAYESVGRYPKIKSTSNIFVDSSADCIFLPIHGELVPFHVSTIKNVSKTEHTLQSGRHIELRINFVTPATAAGGAKKGEFSDPQATFLKEVTLRSMDTSRVLSAFRLINSVKKEFSVREREKRDIDSLVEQEPLRLFKGQGSTPRLSDLNCRPTLGGKGKRSGTLEVHDNGLRFRSNQGNLEIMFQNIKYAFFQEADSKELLIVLHFHLKNEIMVGKKKSKDVQFVTQVGEEHIKLSEVRRSAYDPDELEDEQREREKRNRLNKMFTKFVKQVENASSKTRHNVDFDSPYRALGFHGCPTKTMVMLMPTKDCLVDLIEPPFFILDTHEVEIVYFERVNANLKNFDMTFVYKDYQTFHRVSSVAMRALEGVKTWLDSVHLKYFDGATQMKWKSLLQTIREDPKGFWDEEGGWEGVFGGGEVDEDDEDDDDEDDDAYSSAASDSDEIDSEEFDEPSASEDEDEFAGEDDLDSDEEGLDWDELEEQSKRQEKQETDGAPSKKKKKR